MVLAFVEDRTQGNSVLRTLTQTRRPNNMDNNTTRREFARRSSLSVLAVMGAGIIAPVGYATPYWNQGSDWDGCLHYLEELFPNDTTARTDFENQHDPSSGYGCVDACLEFSRSGVSPLAPLNNATQEQIFDAVKAECCSY